MNPILDEKAELMEICMTLQNQKIDNARLAMEEANKVATNKDEVEEDLTEDFIREMQAEAEVFGKRLNLAAREMIELEEIDIKRMDVVGKGALVGTDKQNFFITVAIGPIKLEENTYFVISDQAPIYKEMEGLKVGDSFQFRDMEYKITRLL